MLNEAFSTISNNDNYGKILLSSLNFFERRTYSTSPSVKMVLSGNEQYTINGKHYSLKKNRFIVLDSNSLVEINIESEENVNGVCIFPKKELINEVAMVQISSQESLIDNPFEHTEICLSQSLSTIDENRTGRFLSLNMDSILQDREQSKPIDFEKFYLDLADCIVYDQLELEGKLSKISSIKKTTKEELFYRVTIAKQFIEDSFTQSIRLEDISREACLSKYHFLRTFQALFKISPYQYILQLRLQKAKSLLALDYSYDQVSSLVGFSDGKNLRKAIKKLDLK
jgi:AraC-like DNA-binding protein